MGKYHLIADDNLLDKDQTISFHLQPIFVRKSNFDKMFEIVFRSYFVFTKSQLNLNNFFWSRSDQKTSPVCFSNKRRRQGRKRNVRILGHQMNIYMTFGEVAPSHSD